jgi:mannosyltransferase
MDYVGVGSRAAMEQRLERLGLARWWGCAAAVGITVGLGVFRLGSRSLWGDEAFSVTLAGRPLGEFWRVVTGSQANMSLYYLLLKGWTTFGQDETTVRALSLTAAALTVPALFVAAERLFDRRVAILAVLLLAVNPFFLRYGQEARSYSLVLLLATAATAVFVVLEERPYGGRAELAYVVLGALAMYAHFFAAFVLASHLLALAIVRRPLRAQVVRLACVGVLSLPLALFVLFRDAGQVSHLTRPTPADVRDALTQLAGGTGPLLLLYGLAALVALWSWFRTRERWRCWPLTVAVSWAATPVVGAIVISLGKPLFAPRFLTIALPGIALVVAAGLARLRPAATLAALLLVVALSVVQVARVQGRPQEDFRAATAYVLDNAAPGDAIAFYRTSRRIPFEYYAGRQAERWLPRSLLPTSPYGRFDLIADYRHTQLSHSELAAIAAAASRDRVWLFLSRPENERVREKRENRARLLRTVERRAHLRLHRLFAGLDIRLYEPASGA